MVSSSTSKGSVFQRIGATINRWFDRLSRWEDRLSGREPRQPILPPIPFKAPKLSYIRISNDAADKDRLVAEGFTHLEGALAIDVYEYDEDGKWHGDFLGTEGALRERGCDGAISFAARYFGVTEADIRLDYDIVITPEESEYSDDGTPWARGFHGRILAKKRG
jgi:hypothetical protein